MTTNASPTQEHLKYMMVDPLPFQISTEYSETIAVAAEPTVMFEYICEWNHCFKGFHDPKEYYLHVNEHIKGNKQIVDNETTGSNTAQSTITSVCLWKDCWNKHVLSSEGLIEHVRIHTLEKPYVCPVKSCKAKFGVKTNCMAHGRTRHNRSFKPVFIDIYKNMTELEQQQEQMEEEEEEETVQMETV
jgi:hypothetical protein